LSSKAIDIQRGNIVANRSNHHRHRPDASAGAGMPLRVPAATSALALVLALSGAAVHAQGQPAAQGKSAGAQQAAYPPARPKKKKNAQSTSVLQAVVVTGERQAIMTAQRIKPTGR
jgi:hypothetical protein